QYCGLERAYSRFGGAHAHVCIVSAAYSLRSITPSASNFAQCLCPDPGVSLRHAAAVGTAGSGVTPSPPSAVWPEREKFVGMPKFHDPAPYDIDDHPGYKQIFDGESFTGWDADPTIWRIESGVMVGETVEGKPGGKQLHRLSRREGTR